MNPKKIQCIEVFFYSKFIKEKKIVDAFTHSPVFQRAKVNGALVRNAHSKSSYQLLMVVVLRGVKQYLKRQLLCSLLSKVSRLPISEERKCNR